MVGSHGNSAMPRQIERVTMDATRSSSRWVSVAKMTAVTAEGIAATRMTTARAIPLRSKNQAAAHPINRPPTIRVVTPSNARGQVRFKAAKLMERPSTRLASGVVAKCNGVRMVTSQEGNFHSNNFNNKMRLSAINGGAERNRMEERLIDRAPSPCLTAIA